MRPKEEVDTKMQTGTFILSEKIDDTKMKKNEKEMKKEMKRLEKEKQEREKREKKAREKEKEREKLSKKGKVVCGACGGKCSGEVLRVTDKYFHTACFTCRSCSASLAKGGFFCKDNHYYCPQDYQRAFGTRCAACNQYVEGEVVSALGNTYHQKCFTCARCKRAFPSGEKVTYTGAEVVCSQCVAPQRQTARASSAAPAPSPSPAPTPAPAQAVNNRAPVSPDRNHEPNPNECAGCGQELSEGQALVALDRNNVVLFRPKKLQNKFEDSLVVYKGEPETLKAFIKENFHGLVGVRQKDNLQDFSNPLVVAYYDVDYVKNPKGTNYWRNRVLKVAKEMSEVTFAISDKDDFTNEMNEFGVDFAKGDKPVVAGRDADGNKFVMSAEFR
ncbi:hypothetical protein evm_002956 [Chilo suppressalis]|nr:hypothetical protein evm_002956 [Chilo suppressalis]